MTEETNRLLTIALTNRNTEEAKRIISEIPSYVFPSWNEGFNFLCYTLRNRYFEIAKHLIICGCLLRVGIVKPTALHLAVLHAPLEIVMLVHKLFWRDRITCNLLDENRGGMNAFHLLMIRMPVDEECHKILHYLLKHCPADVTSTTTLLSPIHYAAGYGNIEMVRQLLSIDPTQVNNVSENRNYTPLHFATERNHIDVVKLLLDNFAKVDAKTTNNETAFCIAVRLKLKPIIDLFLTHYGSMRDSHPLQDDKMVIYSAVLSRDVTILEDLLNRGLNPNHVEEHGNMTPLLLAIEHGCLDSVQLLVNHGADLNVVKTPLESDYSDRDGYSALHFAVSNLPIFTFLLLKGADSNIVDSKKQNTLHIAVEKENISLIYLIMNHGRDFLSLFTPDFEGMTPLHIAVIKEQDQIVELFLKNGVSVNLRTTSQLTSMHLAAKDEIWSVMNILVCYGAGACVSGSMDEETPLFYAALSGNLEIVKILYTICGRQSVTWPEGHAALYAASYNGHVEIVKFLLEEGANPNLRIGRFLSPLHAAAQRGHKTIVNLLIEIGAVVDRQDENDISTPLLAALANGHDEIAAIIQARGANVNAKIRRAVFDIRSEFESLLICGYESKLYFHEKLQVDYTPIYFAILRGDLSLVEKLINRGADVNAITESGENPLLLAIKQQSVEIVSLLLNSGANVRYQNSRLLFTAVSLNNVAIVNLLLEKGHTSDYVGNLGNQGGFTVMHVAIKENNLEIVDALLRNKFQLDACTEKDYVLHYAIDKKNDKIIHKLIDSGAPVNTACSKGLNPSLHALLSGSTRIFMKLVNRGAALKERSILGKNLLHFAMDNLLKEDVIKFLIEIGVDVNERNEFLLSLIERIIHSQTEQIEVVNSRFSQLVINEMNERTNPEEILDPPSNESENDEGSDKVFDNSFNGLPVRRGVYNCNKILGYLLKYGMDVNTIINLMNQTILHYTCISSNTEAVRLLILYNPDFNATDFNKRTPFYYAVEHANWAWSMFHKECCSDVYDEEEELYISPDIHWNDRDNIERFQRQFPEDNWKKLLRNRDEFKKIARLMTQALVKLEAAGHELHKENIELLESETVYIYYHMCKREILSLMQTVIVDDISLFDILIADEVTLTSLVGNEQIQTFMRENDLNALYPLYGNELRFRFDTGIERKNLMCVAGNNFSQAIKVSLPDLVQEFIFRQLSLSEIKNLCRINAPFYFVSYDDSDED